VQQGRQRINRPGEVQILNALGKKSTNSSTFMWAIPPRGTLDVSTGPLLQQCSQETASKTDAQTQEPKRSHQMAKRGGENGGGLVSKGGIEMLDLLEPARSK
jgi:hypothetical protein